MISLAAFGFERQPIIQTIRADELDSRFVRLIQRAAKRAIEIEEEPAAQFALGNIKHPAIPAHAGLGIPPASDRLADRLEPDRQRKFQ